MVQEGHLHHSDGALMRVWCVDEREHFRQCGGEKSGGMVVEKCWHNDEGLEVQRVNTKYNDESL